MEFKWISRPSRHLTQAGSAAEDILQSAGAEHDYEVNLKAELDIMLLHEKLDLLREKQWEELLEIQREQLKELARLNGTRLPPPN